MLIRHVRWEADTSGKWRRTTHDYFKTPAASQNGFKLSMLVIFWVSGVSGKNPIKFPINSRSTALSGPISGFYTKHGYRLHVGTARCEFWAYTTTVRCHKSLPGRPPILSSTATT